MSRFTYIVTSYKDPPQIYRLLGRLRTLSPRARLIVSHDQKGPVLDAETLACLGAELWTTPTPITWGDSSYLQSIVEAFERLSPLPPGGWVTLLTAQDYPLRRLESYEQFLAQCKGDMVLEEPSPGPDLDALLVRYRRRTIQLPAWLRQRRQLMRIVRKIATVSPGMIWSPRPAGVPDCVEIDRFRTPFRAGFQVRKGSDLFALNDRAMAALLAADKDILRYFARCSTPSEAYYHTVLLNNPALTNFPDALHYTKWGAASHPELLDNADLASLQGTGKWFARKFSADAPLLDELEAALDAPVD